jgi:hypothetical protein
MTNGDCIKGVTVVDISFKIKGKRVQPDNMTDVLDIIFLKFVGEKINDSVALIRCNKHGREPSVLVKGQDLDNLEYEVSGCCEDLINKAKKTLNC